MRFKGLKIYYFIHMFLFPFAHFVCQLKYLTLYNFVLKEKYITVVCN